MHAVMGSNHYLTALFFCPLHTNKEAPSLRIGQLLWDDWHGRFAGQSCWWKGDIKQVAESMGDEMPKSAEVVAY